MVIDKNRLIIGLLILFIFFFSFFLNLDYFILFFITFFVIYELYKSKFIISIYDYVIILFFILMFPIFYYRFDLIKLLNILLFFSILILILFPNFHFKKLFLLIILIFIHNFFSILYFDRNIFYFIFFISFFNDTIAYIAGRFVKGPLIIPQISPNKTWSGTIISIFLSTLLIYNFDISLLLSFVLSLSLFIGDIFFSYIKRKINIKDFSNLLQNHGGVLDRLDSMFLFIVLINLKFL